MKNVIVIGGGPAGMMAAGIAAREGNKVTLIEKNDKLGKKLFITGKGRCNLTNAADSETLISNTIGNPYFMYGAYYTFDSAAVMGFFEELGVPLKVERGQRVFPKSGKSSDIVRAMEKFLQISGVKVLLNTRVTGLIFESDVEKVVKGVKTRAGEMPADSVIIATGGLSYPVTGSTGDGFQFAKSVEHNITKCYPSLVPLVTKNDFVPKLQGLSLKNVAVSVNVDGKNVYKDFGEMMFTHFGVTGPVILSASRYVVDKFDKKVELIIDLKPALDENELDNRILRDFKKYQNKDFKNSLEDLLPQKLIPIIIELSKINPEKKVNSITKDERKRLVNLLKNLTVEAVRTRDFDEAVITFGGVSVDEIDPSTMRSKLCENLLFAGEVIDVDAFTGGFNLQIAFSTGYLAGINI